VTKFLKTAAKAPETLAEALEANVALILSNAKRFAHERELHLYIKQKKNGQYFILSILLNLKKFIEE
jgi:hypothetical protein